MLGHQVEVLAPDQFRTVPCPTYPEIRLALRPGARIAERIAALRPDAVHLATEGPLGIAARRQCLRRGLPFTTSYHTRFPEYLSARFPLPLAVGYAAMRWFHRPSQAVMVADAQHAVGARGPRLHQHRGLVARGRHRAVPAGPRAGARAAPAGPSLRRPGRGREEPRSVPRDADRRREQARGRRRSAAARAARPLSRGPFRRRALRRGPCPSLCERRRVRVPEPDRHLRAGAARGARLGPAGRGLPGAGPARRHQRLRLRRPRHRSRARAPRRRSRSRGSAAAPTPCASPGAAAPSSSWATSRRSSAPCPGRQSSRRLAGYFRQQRSRCGRRHDAPSSLGRPIGQSSQWLSRGIAAPRQPRRKSRSAPWFACSTWSTYIRW